MSFWAKGLKVKTHRYSEMNDTSLVIQGLVNQIQEESPAAVIQDITTIALEGKFLHTTILYYDNKPPIAIPLDASVDISVQRGHKPEDLAGALSKQIQVSNAYRETAGQKTLESQSFIPDKDGEILRQAAEMWGIETEGRASEEVKKDIVDKMLRYSQPITGAE